MKLIKNMEEILNNLMFSIRRFPLVVLSSSLTTLILIFIVNNDAVLADSTLDILKKTAMTAALGFPLFLIIKLVFERFEGFKKEYRYLSYFTVIIFLITYYFLFIEDFRTVSMSRFTVLNISFYLIVLLVHYFYKRDKFELYTAEILSRFFVSAVYAAVLFVGLTAILFTVDKLFELSLAGEVYITAWLTAAGIFAPIHLLAGLPKFEDEFTAEDFSSFLRVLLFYIVMPLIAVYTIILYLYFVKIMLAGEWPQNLLGHLVLWYSLITLSVIFLIKPFQKSSRWARTFIFWLPKVIILPLIMMFSALWIRISEYGITENRYYVALAGCWVFAVMLYYIFSREKRNTLLILSLAVITLLSVFGPWSSFAVSINSQNMRFEDILRENEMLVEGKIIKRDEIPSREVRKEISAVIRYFDRNHSLNDLKYLPDDFKVEDMESVFGFKYQYYYSGQVRYFYHEPAELIKAVDVGEYDLFIELNYGSNQGKIYTKDYNDFKLEFSADDMEIKIFRLEKLLFDRSLKDKLAELHRLLETKDQLSLDGGEHSYQYEDEKIKLQILFRNFSGRVYDSQPGRMELQRLNSFVFIKFK